MSLYLWRLFEVARHAWFSEGSAAKYVCMYCWQILTILFRNGDGENWAQWNCNLNCNGKPENVTKFELQFYCVSYSEIVTTRQEALLCDGCERWQHRRHGTGITRGEQSERVWRYHGNASFAKTRNCYG